MQLPIVNVPRKFDPADPEPCAGCGSCCRYVTIELKRPRAKADYDEIRWFLLHENISVFIDDDGWYVEFATACRNLDGHRCTIYHQRPLVCSEYDVKNCTQYGDGDPYNVLFRTEQQYLDYLRRHRPKAYAWVMDPRGERRKSSASQRKSRHTAAESPRLSPIRRTAAKREPVAV